MSDLCKIVLGGKHSFLLTIIITDICLQNSQDYQVSKKNGHDLTYLYDQNSSLQSLYMVLLAKSKHKIVHEEKGG